MVTEFGKLPVVQIPSVLGLVLLKLDTIVLLRQRTLLIEARWVMLLQTLLTTWCMPGLHGDKCPHRLGLIEAVLAPGL